MSKAKSLTLVGFAYVVAIAVGAAWLVWGAGTPAGCGWTRWSPTYWARW
jgi:hypothetical protein